MVLNTTFSNIRSFKTTIIGFLLMLAAQFQKIVSKRSKKNLVAQKSMHRTIYKGKI